MNRTLGRNKDHREHMMRNLATSLALYEVVTTTEAKGKELKSYFDIIMSRALKNDLPAKRYIFGVFFDKNAAQKVINELVPRYEKRNSGFVKSYHLEPRLGDNAPRLRLELVDRKVFVTKKKTDEKATAEEPEAKDTTVVIKEKKTKKVEAKDNA